MRVLKVILCSLASALLCGCAGYHLGPVNGAVAGSQTIEVLPFNNQTLQPRLGDALTQALRERLQVDGTYRLVTGKAGDLVMSGTIRDYHQEGLGYLNNDAATAQNYRVGIVAHVVVRNSTTGKAVLDRDVKGQTLISVGADLASAERQATPLLAADLARNISVLLTDGSW